MQIAELLRLLYVQIGKSSGELSISSVKASDALGLFNRMTAVYKGLTVDVYTVDKAEVNLTRQDLVELINVCIVLPRVYKANMTERQSLCAFVNCVCAVNQSIS